MRYFFLRDEPKVPGHSGFPVACVATRLDSNGMVYFGVSVHNPLDTYNREMAKEIATGRAYKLDAPHAPCTRGVLSIILLVIATTKNPDGTYFYPQRAVDAANLWLEKHAAKKAA
jgi:hypothetical protein